jgi:DNA polymerase-3 subunit delta'
MFSKLIGSESVKHTLRRLVENGRVPNSLLFAGDEGVGKRQFAIRLAQQFMCSAILEGKACGVCPACRRTATFRYPKPDDKDAHELISFSDHPDVGIVIPYNRNILIAAIRHLEVEANFRPYEAEARFFIIDDAEKMNDAAANALLKTLEEPPATTHILLISSRLDALLPTIRSRCQTIRFAPASNDEVENFLIQDRAFSRDEAKLAARFSRGSVGRAVGMKVEKFRVGRARMLAVVVAAIKTQALAEMLRIGEEMNDAKNKDGFEASLDILASLIHDIWSISVSGDVSRIINTDLTEELKSLAADANRAYLAAWLAEIDVLRENLIVNINRKLATDALFVTMAA